MSFKLKFWSAVVLQIIIVFAVLAFNQLQFVGCNRVALKIVQPRDPISLFQGHYLILNYEISRIDKSALTGYCGQGAGLSSGEEVYVALKEQGNYWVPLCVSGNKPNSEKVFIKGTVLSNYGKTISIKYGIENYFIQEKDWQEIEKKFRNMVSNQEVLIEVALSGSGNAMIRKIIVENEEVDVSKITEPNQPSSGSFASAQNKARDSRIIAALSQMRTMMVIAFNEEEDFDNFSCDYSDMKNLCAEVENQNSPVFIARNKAFGSDQACFFAFLNSGEWFCVDYTGVFGTTNIFPGTDGFCVDTVSAICPPLSSN